MSHWSLRVLLVAVCLAVGVPAYAGPDAPLRLKARTFVPPSNLHSIAQLRQPARTHGPDTATRRHLIVQFAGPITRDDLSALSAAGAVPLRYVPDNAVAVSVDASFDAATIARARWAGTLDATDRLSVETAADLWGAVALHPKTVIEFHPDVTRAFADARLSAANAHRISTPYLPAYLAIVDTDRVAVEALAADESVAWIYPAAANISTDAMLACEGILSAEGVVANYATMGDGWDGPGLNGADLTYFLQYPSVDLGASVQRTEIARALAEWARYIDVRWNLASRAGENRSVTILWGGTDHGDGYPFSPEVLAHTFYPAPVAPETIAGDLHFNENYLWGAGDASRYDVFSVALHELGHALGLAHSSNPDAVMYPMYQGIVSGLTTEDIAAARSLYAQAQPTTLPAGWTDTTIGGPVAGTAVARESVYTIDASGRDIWDTSDEFRYVSTTLTGDGDIIARVDSLEAVNRWSKAGVMIRASTDPGSPHAFMLVSGSKGLAFQRRKAAGGLTVSTDAIPGVAPQWLWLSRRGSTVEAYAAADGQAWRFVGTDTIALGTTVFAGLAVTSHEPGAVATAVFSRVSVTRATAWTSNDIGAVGVAGSWTPTATGGAVKGAGADIWGAADAFHFVWRPLRGDGEIIARVASVQFVKSWSKAGVMIRANLDPDSPHAFMLVSAGKGYAFQRRTEPGGWSEHTAGGSGTAPEWIRLVRRANIISAYRSDDGASWIFVGSDTILMPQDVLVGLAVSSHTTSATSRAVFEHVAVASR